MGDPAIDACDHAFTQTRLVGGRLVTTCRCGVLVSTDFSLRFDPPDWDNILCSSEEDTYAH
jgi:hypothetical protein